MTIAAVLGLDTAAGAYLARLLAARGILVRGTGSADLLDRLGVAGDVARVVDVDIVTAGADRIYDLRGNPAATADLVRKLGPRRLFVAVDPGDATSTEELARARAAGSYVATGRVYPHESRLGPGTSPMARIVAAIATGGDPASVDLATSLDCGWTAEYVDAMARMLETRIPHDLVIATGHVFTGAAAAATAAAWFNRVSVLPVDAPPSVLAGDPRPAAEILGWSATTWGTDLVEVLCEGAG